MTERASGSLPPVKPSVSTPAYDRGNRGVGIVHLGLGAFHKAHQAYYTDRALEASGGDWRIMGVSIRNCDAADQINAQDGVFTLLSRDAEGTDARLIGSVKGAICLAKEAARVLDVMTDANTRIVSITVTEKGYGINPASGEADVDNPVVASDLTGTDMPRGILGLLVEALRLRRSQGTKPFTVLSCDNLPSNGVYVRNGVIDFARRKDPELADWIAENVSFPSTMVDRITPAATDATFALAQEMTGWADHCAIEAEGFHQWIIEDDFSDGRPNWEAAGAIFTADVEPYEQMKLRMLNGSHSLIAYMGYLAGYQHVRDAMADENIKTLVRRHLYTTLKTLPDIEGIDFKAYADALLVRFANPNIAHQTFQIATDGSQKMPQRIFSPADDAAQSGLSTRPFAFATAIWLHFCRGKTGDGATFEINDPIAAKLTAAALCDDVDETLGVINGLPGLIPERLASNRAWVAEVLEIMTALRNKNLQEVVAAEAARVNATSK